jgi:hypothetical protein
MYLYIEHVALINVWGTRNASTHCVRWNWSLLTPLFKHVKNTARYVVHALGMAQVIDQVLGAWAGLGVQNSSLHKRLWINESAGSQPVERHGNEDAWRGLLDTRSRSSPQSRGCTCHAVHRIHVTWKDAVAKETTTCLEKGSEGRSTKMLILSSTCVNDFMFKSVGLKFWYFGWKCCSCVYLTTPFK